MKIEIGPYKDWIGPYQIADMVFFWHSRWPANCERWDYRLHDKFGEWLSNTWVNDVCVWFESKRERNIKIHIDKYDTWSMDHTLSKIIVPMLKQLKETKHGAPGVDDEDVPEELKSTSAPPLTEEQTNWGDVDNNHFKRWDWVLDEMIWAFTQISEDADDDFYDAYEEGEEVKVHSWETEEDARHRGKLNMEKTKAHSNRIRNGTKLFGKYYQNLWD